VIGEVHPLTIGLVAATVLFANASGATLLVAVMHSFAPIVQACSRC
jgi:hypothetical protein